MEIRRIAEKINQEKEFVVGFDVGSQRINGYAKFVRNGEKLSIEEEFRNMTYDIKKTLKQYHEQWKEVWV